jgi:hypothetical protein
MVATLKGFPFHWPMGADNLLLVSVGTGYPEFKKKFNEIDEATMLTWASSIPEMLMQDASWQNQVMLQWLSKSPTAETMDSEIGDLNEDVMSGTPLISYLRYNFCIKKDNLNGLGLKKEFTDRDATIIADMARAKNKERLFQIGCCASSVIKHEHFDDF